MFPRRQIYSSIGTNLAAGIRSDDVIYSYLPLYHASGVQVGLGSALAFGNRDDIQYQVLPSFRKLMFKN